MYTLLPFGAIFGHNLALFRWFLSRSPFVRAIKKQDSGRHASGFLVVIFRVVSASSGSLVVIFWVVSSWSGWRPVSFVMWCGGAVGARGGGRAAATGRRPRGPKSQTGPGGNAPGHPSPRGRRGPTPRPPGKAPGHPSHRSQAPRTPRPQGQGSSCQPKRCWCSVAVAGPKHFLTTCVTRSSDVYCVEWGPLLVA